MEPLDQRHPGWDLALRLGLGDRGEAVVKFLDSRAQRKGARLRLLAEHTVDTAGSTLEDLIAKAAADERFGDQFEEAAAAATATGWEAKIRVLGRALAMALQSDDDAAIDEAELLQAAITDFNPIHARGLWVFGQFPKTNPGAFGDIPGLLTRFVPAMEPVADQVAGVLRRHGLISEPFWANGIIGITPLGRRLLQLLVEEGGVEPPLVDQGGRQEATDETEGTFLAGGVDGGTL